MILLTDQSGNKLALEKPASRIISLVPSQTELLFDLGLDNETIGITKFCIHPDKWFREKTRVGGTKTLDLEKIRSLKPDLILANKEENTEDQIRILTKEFQVYISDISTVEQSLQMIRDTGLLTGHTKEAVSIIEKIRTDFNEIQDNKKNVQSALYLIWKNPYMAAGNDTYISEMMNLAGFRNCLEATRYPELNEELIADLSPQFIFLSSEPFPFKDKHREELKKIAPYSNVILVDGEAFSWYGSHMLKVKLYFSRLWEEIERAL